MPRIQPLALLLRPLAPPRPPTRCPHLRFSTVSRRRAEQPSLPPNASSTAPSTPQEARRAAALAAAEASTEADSAQPPAPKPALPSTPADPAPADIDTSSSTTTPKPNSSLHDALALSPPTLPTPQSHSRKAGPQAHQPLPPPRYHVARSNTRNLPVYTDTKRGGNLRQTTVRKITGDAGALRDELRVLLGTAEGGVYVNATTGQVVVKGHRKGEIEAFLKERGM